MANCGNCGALLAPEASWCGSCLQPIPGAQIRTPKPAEPAVAIPPPALAPVERLRPDLPGREPMAKPVYSRWKGGPTSFGPVTKVLLTILVLAIAPIGGATAYQVLFFIPYIPIAGIVLWGIWRKQQVG